MVSGKSQVLFNWASLVAQLLKNLPAMWETWVRSLGREDTLEKEMATHSCLENPMGREAWWATFHGVGRKELDTIEQLHFHLNRNRNGFDKI